MIFPRDRGQNFNVDYEDSDASFGNGFQENYLNYADPTGITSLPIRQPQPVEQPAPQPIPPETDYYAQQFRNDFAPQPAQPIAQPLALPAFQPAAEPAPMYDPFNSSSGIIEDVEEPFNYAKYLDGGSEPPLEKLVQDVTEATPLAPTQNLVQNESPPVEPTPTGVFGLPITPAQTPEQAQPAQPAQPVGPDPKTVDSLKNQILGQGLTGKWTGSGHGSADANAADMAKIMAGIGITDIKQFGKVPILEEAVAQKGYNGQAAQQDEDGNYFIVTTTGFDYEGNPINSRQSVDPKDLQTLYGSYQPITSNPDEGSYFVPADKSNLVLKDGVTMVKTGETFGNKATGQAVPNTYSERQTGNFFGGTFSGKGNTGYGVQFDSQGNPIFYTQGASSNDLANLMKDLGPIGQIAIAAATGGLSLPAQLAANAGIQLLAGGNLKDIVKGTALSYLGGQAGNLISGSSGITDLLGKTGTDIASRTAQQFVGSGGKADLGQALLGNALSSGVGSLIGQVPGLDNLSPVDRNLTSNLIAAVATGTPIDQAIQNALVGKVSSDVRSSAAQTSNTSTPQPQTYEDLMAGIEPRTSDQPSTDTGPSNDDILRMINYDPSLINNAGVDTLVTKLADDPAIGKARTMDDIDFSGLMGSFDAGPGAVDLSGIDLSNLLALNTPVSNFDYGGGDDFDISSILGGVGREIDFSKIIGDDGRSLGIDTTGLDAGDISNLSELINSQIDTGLTRSLASTDKDTSSGTGLRATGRGQLSMIDPITGATGITGEGFKTIEDLLGSGTAEEIARYTPGSADYSLRSGFETEGGQGFNADSTRGMSLANMGGGQGLSRYNPAQYLEGSTTPIKGTGGTLSETGFLSQSSKANPLGSKYSLGDPRSFINNPTITGQQSVVSPGRTIIDNKDGTYKVVTNTKDGGTKSVNATKAQVNKIISQKPSTSATSKKSTTASGGNNANMIMALMAMMAMMNSRGGGGSSAASSYIPALSANRSQLPYAPTGRPGAGGQTYFSPTTYTPKAAEGGLMGLAGGGMSNLGGYSDGGRLLRGPGDGVSDSIPATIGGKQPARLAEGEFVVPARIVSELGNGSTNAGANKLYDMMDRVQKTRRQTKNVAANTKAHKYLPS